jgi:hypothetical protein
MLRFFMNLSLKQYPIIQKKIKLKIDRDFNHPLKCIFPEESYNEKIRDYCSLLRDISLCLF